MADFQRIILEKHGDWNGRVWLKGKATAFNLFFKLNAAQAEPLTDWQERSHLNIILASMMETNWISNP